MLQFIEGFDTYGTATGNALPSGVMVRRGWTNNGVLAAGRVSGKALSVSSTSTYQIQFSADTEASKTLGIAIRRGNNTFSTTFAAVRETNSSTSHILLRVNTSGFIEVVVAGVLHQTGTTAINLAQWYYIELTYTIANSPGGSYELKINGVTELTGSAMDTMQGSNPYTRFLFIGYTGGSSWSAGTLEVDDIYILDSTGAVNTTFLGSVVVEALYPDGDAGTNQWTPSTGSDGYAMVDDGGLTDDDATYLEDSVSGNRELYTAQSSAATGVIYGVSVEADVRVTDGTPFDINLIAKSGGTTSVGSPHTISSTTYQRIVDLHNVDPDTSALWDVADLNTANFGFEVD